MTEKAEDSPASLGETDVLLMTTLRVLFFLAFSVSSEALVPSQQQHRVKRSCPIKMSASTPLNSAFVFVKPHAVTAPTIELVKAELEKAGLKVTSEGDISSETIDSKKLVDNHYYAIASKATITPPEELVVPEKKFSEFFGEEWADVLKAKKAKTAIQAGKDLGLTGAELDKAWGQAKKDGKIIKLGGGFYCGKLSDDCYTFNAFYMSMRDRFTQPGGIIIVFFVVCSPVTMQDNPTLKSRGLDQNGSLFDLS